MLQIVLAITLSLTFGCPSFAELAPNSFIIDRDLLADNFDPTKLKITLYNHSSQISNGGILLPSNGKDAVQLNNGYEYTIMAHGWVENGSSCFPCDPRDAYLEQGKNVLVLDWGYYSCANSVDAAGAVLCYFQAAYATELVGGYVAKYIASAIQAGLLDPQKLTCLGFSLGAHVCGFIGQFLKAPALGYILARIVALDKAGPGFFPNILNLTSVNKADAAQVCDVHTSAPTFGSAEETGTVDEYLNLGGPEQPPCENGALVQLEDVAGAHIFAVSYWIAAFYDPTLNSTKYSSSDQTGLAIDTSPICADTKSGSYFSTFGSNTLSGKYSCTALDVSIPFDELLKMVIQSLPTMLEATKV